MDEYRQTAFIFKALSDENRLKIMKMLTSGERCAGKILEEVKITQPTLSHHMKILCDSEIVKGRKEGKWIYYSLSPEGIEKVRKLFEKYTSLQYIIDTSDLKL